MRLVLVLALLAQLAACAPVATGEWDRLYFRETNDRLTQVEGREDYRTFRQKLPSFLLP
jgi:hypothetical protein